jgi:hypothetical protein
MAKLTESRRRFVPAPAGPPWLRNWLERHQHPVSFYLHLVGIPMAVAAIPLLFLQEWWWALGLFVGGYGLQFIGHAIEGNDVGELIPIKRALGLPYVAISPRWRQAQTAQGSSLDE